MRCELISGRRRRYRCRATATEEVDGHAYCSTHAGYVRQQQQQ